MIMKKFILSLLFILPISINAQTGIHEKRAETTVIGEVTLLSLGRSGDTNGTASISADDTASEQGKTHYVLAYQNQENRTTAEHRAVDFFADRSDLDHLFDEMIKVLKTGIEVNIPVGENTLYLSRMDLSKYGILMVQVSGRGYFKLGDEQLFALFGKSDQWNKDDWSKKAYKKYMK